jgi:hypothetical protein
MVMLFTSLLLFLSVVLEIPSWLIISILFLSLLEVTLVHVCIYRETLHNIIS